MRKNKIIALICLTFIFSAFALHKYYVSLTQINFKQDKKAVQIIINVFMDDIETALNTDNQIDLQLTTKKELPNNDVYFKKYLNDKLKININNKPYPFTYLGKEYDGDLVYFYLEIENIAAINQFEIENNILTKHFENQQNMVKFKGNNAFMSYLLTKKNNKATIKF